MPLTPGTKVTVNRGRAAILGMIPKLNPTEGLTQQHQQSSPH